ncbi:MAG: hypothetical protein NC124_20320, partial [Clostridium sp.]|nr:hypothetical protein [Clostridium sp.]
MADYLANAWEELLDLLKDNQQTIFQNPLVWIVIGLSAVGIYGLYDVPKKTSMNSLGNVVRKIIQTLLDTTSDIINALGSLTGFLKVVESLLFGRLNKKTLSILSNYAIIFLSMASFMTTFSGLNVVLHWVIAAFVSFGIQVSILIFGIKISGYTQKLKENKRKREKTDANLGHFKNNNEKKIVRIIYRRNWPVNDYITKGSININGNGADKPQYSQDSCEGQKGTTEKHGMCLYIEEHKDHDSMSFAGHTVGNICNG